MRILARIAALLIGLVGLLVLGSGAAAATYVGTDDTVPLSDQIIEVRGVALYTAPRFISSYGPTVHVSVTSMTQADPLFIGAAPSYQMADYLKEHRRTELTSLALTSGKLTTRYLEGKDRIAVPSSLKVWSDSREEQDEVALAWSIPNGQYDLVVMRSDGAFVGPVRVVIGLELPGLFRTTVLVAVGGGAALTVAVVVLVLTLRRRSRVDPARPGGTSR